MNTEQLKEMRRNITALIDDVKYQSDSLTDMERLPVIQLKVFLAKINQLTEQTTILLHYVEIEGKLSDKDYSNEIIEPVEEKTEETLTEDNSESEIIATEEKDQEITIDSSSDSLIAEDKASSIDIMAAIGINEKYLFSSELFNGSTDTLLRVANELSQMTDKNLVNSYLEKLEKEYNWDKENDTVKNFLELVERKFD